MPKATQPRTGRAIICIHAVCLRSLISSSCCVPFSSWVISDVSVLCVTEKHVAGDPRTAVRLKFSFLQWEGNASIPYVCRGHAWLGAGDARRKRPLEVLWLAGRRACQETTQCGQLLTEPGPLKRRGSYPR